MEKNKVNNVDELALHFDLDQTSKAYELGGVNKYWFDYSTNDGEWDMDSYYADFDAWWLSLSTDKKNEIINQMNNK